MGQLGDGTLEDRARPVVVPGLSGVLRLAVGTRHSCALKDDGTVHCWGSNVLAQLALETAPRKHASITAALLEAPVILGGPPPRPKFHGPNASLKPIAVAGVSGATAIASDRARTCAVVADGSVVCWGAIASSALKEHASPKKIAGLDDVAVLSLGSGHSCAVHTNGVVSCWGGNRFGQAAPRSDAIIADNPTRVAGLKDIVGVAVGSYHTCAWSNAGAIYCWGDNRAGQLGVGDVASVREPTRVKAPGTVVHVAVTSQATCVATAERRFLCWGDDAMGTIAVGTGDKKIPTPVDITDNLAAAQPEKAAPPAVPDPICAKIPAYLGYTMARARCRLRRAELGLYRATIEGPDVPRGSESKNIAARHGVIEKGRGLEAFGAHMKALQAYGVKGVIDSEMVALLDAFGALPPGFSAMSLADPVRRPERFPKPGLVMKPFTLTLLTSRVPGGGGGLCSPALDRGYSKG